MQYPKLRIPAATRQTIHQFRGYVHKEHTPDGAFYDMQNMTSDHYPVLSSRPRRSVVLENANMQGILAKDGLCYIDGADFSIDGEKIEGLTLFTACDGCPRQDICGKFQPGKTRCEKSLLSMGGYVLILPDKKWVQTVKTGESYLFGDMEGAFISGGEPVTVSLCKADGTAYGTIAQEQPTDPDEGALWMDTASRALKQWSQSAETWVTVESTYVRIAAIGIDKGFSQYDGITISGFAGTAAESLDGSAVVWQVHTDAIVVSGLVTTLLATTQNITVKRQVPEMDYATVCGNRLWGCRYGRNANGDFVNEIYCSKLGDFKNFHCFMGISTDSGVFSVGSDGPFTGAITHLDHPLFFKENMLHKIYVSETGAHSITHTPCRGVQAGCGKSLAIVGEQLFYKARSGVCVYDGSLPSEVSQDLGSVRYGNATAGAYGNKYYISMENGGEKALFVYDTEKRMWHKEDDLPVLSFCPWDRELYAMTEDKIYGLLGAEGAPDGRVSWWVQTGDMGIVSPDRKYLSRLTVRMALDIGAKASFYVCYDRANVWEHIATVTGKDLQSFSVPIRPKRCDTMSLRLEGEGDVKIYAFTKTVEQGSELS